MDLMTRMLEGVIGRSGASELVIERFAGAVSPETAIPFTPLGERQRVQFERLKARGVIVQEGTRYYIDQPKLQSMRTGDQMGKIAFAATLLAVLATALYLLTK